MILDDGQEPLRLVSSHCDLDPVASASATLTLAAWTVSFIGGDTALNASRYGQGAAVESRSIVDTYYKRLAERDRDGLHELLDPDLVVTYHAGAGVFPWSGRFDGIEGFDTFFAAIAEHLEIIEVVQLQWITDADSVVVQCEGQWRVKASGAVVAGSMVNIFGIADGRISSYDVHADTAAFLQLQHFPRQGVATYPQAGASGR